MAKKKSHSHPAVDAAKKNVASVRSISLDRSESLKALNIMLLKETMERREQISQLRSEIDRLAEDADVLSIVEREVGRIVVSSGLSEIRAAFFEWAATVRGTLDSERLAAGKMKRSMERAALEKAELETSLARASSERDSAVANLSETQRESELKELAAKEETNRLRHLLEQRRDELGVIADLTVTLEESLKNAEAALKVANDRLLFAEREKSDLVSALERMSSEKEKNQKDAAAMTVALRDAEEKLAVLDVLVNDLSKQKEASAFALHEATEKLTEKTRRFEARIGELEIKKCQLEEEKTSLNRERVHLKAEVEELKLVSAEKEYLRSELESTRASLKSANMQFDCVSKEVDATKKALDVVMSEMDANRAQLVVKAKETEVINGELAKLRLEFSSLEKEKEIVYADFESLKMDSTNELSALRSKLDSVEQEKAAADEIKSKQMSDIADLSSEVRRLLSKESELQERNANITELNNRLQENIQSAQRDLELHSEDAHSLKLRMEVLTKNKDDTVHEFQRVKAELDDLVILCNFKRTQIDALDADKAKLESELAETRLALAEMEGQARGAKVNFHKALSLLRSTSELMSTVEEEGGVVLARAAATEDQELDADVQVFAKDLKAIRVAFEIGEAKMEHLSREINLLQEANDKSAMWTWLYPAASTLVAAASFAYAATVKGR